MSKREYRTFTPDQKTEIVLAGLRGDRRVRDVCREYEISETLYYKWRDRLLEDGKAAMARPNEPSVPDAEVKQLRRKVAQLERALGKKTYELEVAGNCCGTGRERPRVQGPRGGRRRTPPHGRGAGGGHQPPGDLPDPHQQAGIRWAG